MKMKNLKRQSAWGLILLLAIIISSCKDEKNYYDPNWERPHCEYTFETEKVYRLSVEYQDVGTSVYFELYDTNPLVEGVEGVAPKRDDVLPLYAGSTDFDGKFNKEIALPSYLNTVYIYTPAFYAQKLIETTVSGNSIIAKDGYAQSVKAVRAGSGNEKYTSQSINGAVITGEAWKTWLGEFDESTGKVTGFNEGSTLTTYETKRVQNTGTYALSITWAPSGYQYIYYYQDPETKRDVIVSKFYDKKGNPIDVKWNDSKVYYDRKVATETSTSLYHPGYDYKGKDLLVDDYQNLYASHTTVIKPKNGNVCPQEYRSSSDLLVGQDAEVAITFLGGLTCWTSSLGYYWYKDGEKPVSYNDIKDRVVMIFPNTQNGNWNEGYEQLYASEQVIGTINGTCVQLKYYPNIANNDPSEGTFTFPAKTRIGFVLATNAWTHRPPYSASWLHEDKKYRAATSSGLSQGVDGNAYDTPRTAVYKDGDYILISFEDHNNDETFADVVFTLKSNPVDAFENIVEVTTKDLTTTSNKGWYSFEDIWPMEGDYDMNDVIISCTQSKTMPYTITTKKDEHGTIIEETRTPANKISKETFTMKTFQNFATYTDGVSCYVELPAGVVVDDIKYYIKRPGVANFEEFTPLKGLHEEDIYKKHGSQIYNQVNGGKCNVIHFINNIRDFRDENGVSAELRVELIYKEGTYSEDETIFKPFICVRNGGNSEEMLEQASYYEVHIPLEAPTNIMPGNLWSKYADASRPATVRDDGSGEFYLRANNIDNNLYGPWYPFAIKFSGATEADVAPLLNPKNETIPISKLYPRYENWVETKGSADADWYKTTLQK